MRWFRHDSFHPWSYVDDDCSVWGIVQEFSQFGGGGTGRFIGYEAYFRDRSIGRSIDENECKKMVEKAFKER